MYDSLHLSENPGSLAFSFPCHPASVCHPHCRGLEKERQGPGPDAPSSGDVNLCVLDSGRTRVPGLPFLKIEGFFSQTYIRQIPKVSGLWMTLRKPASFSIGMNLSGFGNLRTEAGRYSYAPLFPETFPPTPGRIFIKYNL